MRKVVTGFAALAFVAFLATGLIAGEQAEVVPVASNCSAPQASSCGGAQITVLRRAPLRSFFANCRARRAARQAARSSCAGVQAVEVAREIVVIPRRTLRVLNCSNGQCR